MAAQTTDLFRKTGAGTVTTLAAPGKALSATSITVGATTNYPTDTGLVIAIRIVDSAGELVAGTYTEWNAIVASGTSFTIEATPVYGSDQVYPAGSTTQVFIPLSSSAHNDLIDGILVHADQDGTLKAGAVDVAAVLATDVVETAKIKDLNITTAKIAAASVTAMKIDWASTGADGGIWWEELGRTTNSGQSSIAATVAAREFLKVYIVTNNSTTLVTDLTFNSDTGNNYAWRQESNGAADSTDTSCNSIEINPSTSTVNNFYSMEIQNIATAEKNVVWHSSRNVAGAATAPGKVTGRGKWVNTSDQITTITVTASTGNLGAAKLIVLGHN